MNAENLSLDFMKHQLFGHYLRLDGLTEVAINRPGRDPHQNKRSMAEA